MADPAREQINDRVTHLLDRRKQADDRFAAEEAAYVAAVKEINVELASWHLVLEALEANAAKPAAKKAAAKK